MSLGAHPFLSLLDKVFCQIRHLRSTSPSASFSLSSDFGAILQRLDHFRHALCSCRLDVLQPFLHLQDIIDSMWSGTDFLLFKLVPIPIWLGSSPKRRVASVVGRSLANWNLGLAKFRWITFIIYFKLFRTNMISEIRIRLEGICHLFTPIVWYIFS